jgi:alkylation response protein AidB-like acyl-CoA dehydrogenase
MELVVTEEQRSLRDTLRRFFADKSPSEAVRRLMATTEGHDPAVWSRMAGELGLQGLAIPEEYGGSGFGLRELAIVMEEMGRALYCGPFLASAVLAPAMLLSVGDERASHEILPGIADGSTLATLAHDGTLTGRHGLTFEAHPEHPEGGWLLDGTAARVLDGTIADLVLVVARTPAPTLFAVDADAPGLTRQALPTLDQTRKLARLDFAAVPARLVGTEGAAAGALAATLDRAAVALAAEQLGGAQRVLEMSVDYARARRQFGRPIGSFQAIKHKCADMLVEVESSRSAVLHAATVADESPGELPVAAALARAYCSDAYFHAAAETIQIHGGIGFTWEHDAHLHLKRAKSSQTLLGTPSDHRAALAALLGLSRSA